MSFKRHASSVAKILVAGIAMALLLSSAFAREDPKKHYALIFGTIYGSDDRPVYGVRVTIHPVGRRRPSWDLVSDHRGEFAQRVPPGPEDYVVTSEAEMAPVEKGKPQTSKKKKFKAETKVHIAEEERQDITLHLKD